MAGSIVIAKTWFLLCKYTLFPPPASRDKPRSEALSNRLDLPSSGDLPRQNAGVSTFKTG